MNSAYLNKRDSDEYADILKFANEHNNITYSNFDDFVLKQINLFNVPKDAQFSLIENTLDKIISALPSINRIFSRPIIHLKDVYEILPIESVHTVDSKTLAHASIHSEMWEDVGKSGIKPKKLLSLDKTEKYDTYENIAFTRLIDAILAFVKSGVMLLKDVLYGFRDLQFNLLDRTHHSQYFLAIGKLHLEYARSQSQQRTAYLRCIEKLLFIEKAVRRKLRSPVYIKCKKNRKKIVLKKTNTFRSHKDYKQVYNLLKIFENSLEIKDEVSVEEEATHDEYRMFCIFLSLFAAGHFNFTFSERKTMDFAAFKAKAEFKEWTLTLQSVKNRSVDGLRFMFKRDTEYTICLVFREKNEITERGFEAFKRSAKADEYLFVSPHFYGDRDYIYLSLFDVDSFRRIQQLILRGMIYSDSSHTDCHFCGAVLVKNGDKYECGVCRAEIACRICPQTNEAYYTSGISKHKSVLYNSSQYLQGRKFLHDRYSEAQLHFRNITPIADDGEFICPRCYKKHGSSLKK